MGCDIHLVLEKRVNEKWVGVDAFSGHHRAKWTLRNEKDMDWSSPVARDRNYRRFAALAGVRGEGPEPRGIPTDVSDTSSLMLERWGTDAHSHSWLPLSDAARIFKETGGELNEYAGEYPESYFFNVDGSDERENVDDYRAVFWFDN